MNKMIRDLQKAENTLTFVKNQSDESVAELLVEGTRAIQRAIERLFEIKKTAIKYGLTK